MNKVSHFHIPIKDIERAKKFYSDNFGWKIGSSNKYIVVTTSEIGGINGALYKKENPEDVISIVIRVPSIDEYLKKIVAAGGKIKTKKTPESNIGSHAEFYDTENNIIGWEEKDR